MSNQVFKKNFNQQEDISQEAIDAALKVLKSGRLFRYNNGENEVGETAKLEVEFASYMGSKYCLACASCGSALYLALKSIGVKVGDVVLCNSFTLAPVPGALENSGAKVVLVEIESENYTIDLVDLETKAIETKAKFLLLSHMRGHIVDMDKLMQICTRLNVKVIEDCAHTMGATWNGKKSGSFGIVSCFSTQTYKHLNSGEGGLLVTDDPKVISKAILYSGSYMLYDKHVSRPELSVFDEFKLETPNFSLRMDNLRAAILRVQLKTLDTQCQRWNERYAVVETILRTAKHLCCPKRHSKEGFVASSFQFSIENQSEDKIREFLAAANQSGLVIKWFGEKKPAGFTSSYKTWQYLITNFNLTNTDNILSKLCDFRLPLTFSLDDCKCVATIIKNLSDEIFS
ncbi:DegT/DnrJ/EryC1/StrS family aminotransferase [Desulfovibrio litoralis]|uniref:dTDP-4-amino-4,6-dideoxygalactose transaminase n=1 Tax=Desulfovibrio litoralis DSM 11393 TaxID=1121455 RepID=A0A1M7SMW9_9BACT|nr:DegT/DnrJ/EryC1/StrS aminotransferase family protein [Desulfovibrio litoralis]SHN59822.1 dTDP-4-amino-4,6-dideoxygalactose transaminase [Desulfovibrio litoralis DSM 11393]